MLNVSKGTYFALSASCLSLGHTQASEDILAEWDWASPAARGPHGDGEVARGDAGEAEPWQGADSRRGLATVL